MYVLCNGRHPAWKPVDMEKIPWFSLGFSTIGGRWLALGFLNHQQYHISPPKIPAIETFQRLRFPAIPGEVMWNQRETNALNFSQGGGHGRGLLRESVSWQSEWDLGPTLGGESLWYYKTIQIKVSLKSNLKLYIECLQPVFLISFCHHYLEIFEAVDSFNPTCPPFFWTPTAQLTEYSYLDGQLRSVLMELFWELVILRMSWAPSLLRLVAAETRSHLEVNR